MDQLLPSRLDSFWITVKGGTRDECLGRGLTLFSGRSLHLESWTPTPSSSRCVHTLRVMGRPDLAVEWNTTNATVVQVPVQLTVIPFNQTFYHSMCQRDGLGVAYTVSDSERGLWAGFAPADEVMLAFLCPVSRKILFSTECEPPSSSSSPVPFGTCVSRSFCPNADVLAQVTFTSQSGNFSLTGTALLRVGNVSFCPSYALWTARVDLLSPSIPYFPGDNATILVSTPFLPSPLKSFRFNVVVMQGGTLPSLLSSSYSIQSSLDDAGVLSVSGTAIRRNKKDENLVQLTVQIDRRFTGVAGLLRFVPGSFVFDLRGGGYYVMPICTQGFTCSNEGVVNAVLDFRRVTSIVSHPSARTMVYWPALQDSAPVYPVSIATVGVWNCMGCVTTVEARCTSLTRKSLDTPYSSCASVLPLGDSGTGIVRVELMEHAVSTLVHVDVWTPANFSVVYLEGLDGLSGRFKIMTWLKWGLRDAFLQGPPVDATPYLVPLGAQFSSSSSSLILNGEEWTCAPGYHLPFSVGTPTLFHGHCNAEYAQSRLDDYSTVPFLFTGGAGVADTYLLARSVLHPVTPSATLLHLSRKSGLVDPARPPFDSLTGNDDWVNRVDIQGGGLVVLLNRGLTPFCLEGRFLVIPAAPASLEVSLSHTALATQFDPWKNEMLPTLATVTGAWLTSSDGSVVDVRDDPRLYWTTPSTPRLGQDLDMLPGAAVQTKNSTGTFLVQFKMLGMPCLTASLSLTVYPFSVQTSAIVCPSCPSVLTQPDDPVSAQFPLLFPRSIPIAAFTVQFVLVDGTTREKQQKMAVSGPVAWVDGRIISLGDGFLTVSTYNVQQDYVIQTTQRCVKNYTALCNGVPCDSGALKLAPEGDGAAMAPFYYDTTLNITLKLLIVDGTFMVVHWLDGLRLEVDHVDVSPAYFEYVGLAFGETVLDLVFPADYAPMQRVPPHTLFVHRLASVEISGPGTLSQIHCSGVWEQGLYTVAARLSDGELFEPGEEERVLSLDGDVLAPGITAGVVRVVTAGFGWIQASFRGVSGNRFVVEATSTSKLIETVDLRFLPVFWTATPSQSLHLDADEMLFPIFDIAAHQKLLFLDKILTWTAAPKHVVSFRHNGLTAAMMMSLLSDYYCSTLVISAELCPCGVQASPRLFSGRVHVNMVPSVSGQIDLGEKTGLALPRTPVGDTLTIPVFLFVKKPSILSSYDVSIALDEVTLSARDCDGGGLASSTCTLSNTTTGQQQRVVMRATAAVPDEDAQGGRILIALVQGVVRLEAWSSIFVTLHHATVDGTRVLGPTVFRFSVRVGLFAELDPHQPYTNAVGPLRIPEFSSYNTLMTELQVCCHASVARRGSRLARSFPVYFKPSKIAGLLGGETWVPLDLMDPRFRVQYDHTLLHMRGGVWEIRDSAPDFASTRIEISFLQRDSNPLLRTHVLLTMVSIAGLALTPSPIQLLRVHCSPTVFQSKRLIGSFVLHNDLGVVPFDSSDVVFSRVDSQGIVNVQEAPLGGVLVTGTSPGMTQIALHVNGFTIAADVLVRNSSILLKSVRLASPLVFADCLDAVVTPSLLGWLEDDLFLPSLAFLDPPLAFSGPLRNRGGLTLALLGNTLWHTPGALSVVIPACQDRPQETVASPLLTRVLACPIPHESADVELSPITYDDGGGRAGFTVTLVGVDVEGFFIHMLIDATLLDCTPQPSFSDCVVNSPAGHLIAAGALKSAKGVDRISVAVVGYSGSVSNAWGFVEVCQRGAVRRFPIVAGRFGIVTPGQDPVKLLMPVLPVVDSWTLFRLYRVGVDLRAANFALQLMTNRQSLVEHVFYSNDGEISLMFHVTDRFLVSNIAFVNVQLVCHSGALPPHLAGLGVTQAALVGNGWYAIQWEGVTPKAVVGVLFQVNTSSTIAPFNWDDSTSETILEVGQPLQACPRLATSKAIFLVSFRIKTSLPSPRIAALVACRIHVASRRVTFTSAKSAKGWTTMTVSLESFIRVRQVQTLVMESWFSTLLLLNQPPISMTRSIVNVSSDDSPFLVQFNRLSLVNDTQDPPIPCPSGHFFSGNGSYSLLPLHAVAGEDCYGMVCIDGYVLSGPESEASSCVPFEVSVNVAWICVTVILFLSCIVSTVVCCISMARSRHETPLPTPPFMPNQGPTEDDKLFGSFDSTNSGPQWDDMGHVCLEDYSAMALEGDFLAAQRDRPTNDSPLFAA